jgi:DNA repair photolyase
MQKAPSPRWGLTAIKEVSMQQPTTVSAPVVRKKTAAGPIIYEPGGRAAEYAPLAANLYSGCSHGCIYCFAPAACHRQREKFHADVQPKHDALSRLKKDALKLAGDPREILLSFATDPYQSLESKLGITRGAIKALIDNNLKFTILTKGGTQAVRDFDLLEGYSKTSFGSTIIFLDQQDANKWEPNAAPIQDRIQALRQAYSLGIRTWVSLEPVIDPKQALEIIRELHPIVDHWKIGKLNYNPIVVDWIKFRTDCEKLLVSLSTDYYIKNSLRCL